ncbi:hypothetical protein MWMV17_MWMV17_02203 [Acinetobacter calcoaceticus]|uniref:ACT domain-containing protein n=1 Tax=Acinetobacter calcoaceticus DSM 30006 = CIP 81.8 TaxID=981331 RepID=A0ABN0K7Y1_ACICA|nr:hypothetical protein [Acinetobacter calcoaceticus]ENV99652.1 hypothetical protein F936_02738 [Acinetobacter calcoaceticus DSM 30006 = CIP 81.8]CAI3141589.1 hypothetical protein MWMV17_MWMV17_02203 [Acinetobacter calcoaceticus]SUU53209.1 Uncharacterised protein [Acinetobacter calcoaceticus]
MKDMIGNSFITNADAFSVATQIYVRMRRVTGRVIDAMYVIQNKDYAKYVITVALETEDDELKRCVERLRSLVDAIPEPSQKEKLADVKVDEDSEITAEDIYRAQVPHHYIGALR